MFGAEYYLMIPLAKSEWVHKGRRPEEKIARGERDSASPWLSYPAPLAPTNSPTVSFYDCQPACSHFRSLPDQWSPSTLEAMRTQAFTEESFMTRATP
jgi:hypothetical protein